MMLLSGAGPPPEVMTGPMRVIGDVLPLTPAIRLLQNVWLGFAWEWQPLIVVTAVLLAAAALAVRSFRWE
jgi:ABC-2 type transport system permease protein